MSTPRVAGLQPRSRDTREKILSSAKALFAEKGFDAVSIEMIARRAGIAKGSVLAHFSEKLSLLAAYFGDSVALATIGIRLTPRPLRSDVLGEFLWPLVAQLVSDPAYLRLMTTTVGDAAFADLHPTMTGLGAALTIALHETGTDHADIAAEIVVAVLLHLAIETRAEIPREGRTVALIAARRKLDSLLAFALRDPL